MFINTTEGGTDMLHMMMLLLHCSLPSNTKKEERNSFIDNLFVFSKNLQEILDVRF